MHSLDGELFTVCCLAVIISTAEKNIDKMAAERREHEPNFDLNYYKAQIFQLGR